MKTVLITGSSSGIGLGIAREFVRRNNLTLFLTDSKQMALKLQMR